LIGRRRPKARRCDHGAGRRGRSWSSNDHKEPSLAIAGARPPASERSHVGLHPGLVDEDETPAIDPILIGLPAGRLRATSGLVCSAATTVFLKLSPRDGRTPDRPIIDLHAARQAPRQSRSVKEADDTRAAASRRERPTKHAACGRQSAADTLRSRAGVRPF